MTSLSIKDSTCFAWNRVRANPAFYFGGFALQMLASFVASMAIVGPITFILTILFIYMKFPNIYLQASNLLISSVFQVLVSGPLILGFYKGIKKDVEFPPAGVLMVFSGFKDYFPAAGLFLFIQIFMLPFSIGFIYLHSIGHLIAGISMLLLLSIVIGPVIINSFILLADGEKSAFGFKAFLRGFSFWSPLLMILVGFVFFVALVAGVLLCCVGLLATFPLASLICWHLCKQNMGSAPLRDSAV